MVAEALTAGIVMVAQNVPSGEPIPTGWIAVTGALGITITTVMVVRRLERGSISDLERALERARDEISLLETQLDETRQQAARDVAAFREEVRQARAEATLMRQDNDSLRGQLREALDMCSVLRRQVHRLQREVHHAEGQMGIQPLSSPDEDENGPVDGQ